MISVTRTRRYKQTWILYHETEQSINRLPLSFRPERTGLNPFAAPPDAVRASHQEYGTNLSAATHR
jgi:hypothetical protein